MSRGVLFLDSSAATKLIVAEPESDALAERLTDHVLVGSALLVPEVSRAVHRTIGRAHDAVLAQVLGLIDLVMVDRAILTVAAELEPAGVRTLDAVHLASALSLGERLDTLIAYDERLLEAARVAGLAAERPHATTAGT